MTLTLNLPFAWVQPLWVRYLEIEMSPRPYHPLHLLQPQLKCKRERAGAGHSGLLGHCSEPFGSRGRWAERAGVRLPLSS